MSIQTDLTSTNDLTLFDLPQADIAVSDQTLNLKVNDRATFVLKDLYVFRDRLNTILNATNYLDTEQELTLLDLANVINKNNLRLGTATKTINLQESSSTDLISVATINSQDYLEPQSSIPIIGLTSIEIKAKPLQAKTVSLLTLSDIITDANGFSVSPDSGFEGMSRLIIKDIDIIDNVDYIITQADLESTNTLYLDLTTSETRLNQAFGSRAASITVPLYRDAPITIDANNLGTTLTPADISVNLDGSLSSDGMPAVGYKSITLDANLTFLSSSAVIDKAQSGGGMINPPGLSIGFKGIEIPNISDTSKTFMSEIVIPETELTSSTVQVRAINSTTSNITGITTVKTDESDSNTEKDVFDSKLITLQNIPYYGVIIDQDILSTTYSTSDSHTIKIMTNDTYNAIGTITIPQLPEKKLKVTGNATSSTYSSETIPFTEMMKSLNRNVSYNKALSSNTVYTNINISPTNFSTTLNVDCNTLVETYGYGATVYGYPDNTISTSNSYKNNCTKLLNKVTIKLPPAPEEPENSVFNILDCSSNCTVIAPSSILNPSSTNLAVLATKLAKEANETLTSNNFIDITSFNSISDLYGVAYYTLNQAQSAPLYDDDKVKFCVVAGQSSGHLSSNFTVSLQSIVPLPTLTPTFYSITYEASASTNANTALPAEHYMIFKFTKDYLELAPSYTVFEGEEASKKPVIKIIGATSAGKKLTTINDGSSYNLFDSTVNKIAMQIFSSSHLPN